MFRILMFVLALAVFTVPVHANRLSVDGLSEEQVADLMLKAAKMKAAPSVNVTDRISEYSEIGQKYGVAMAATAKELGVAANELLDTTVGKVALVLIVWKVMGEELIGFLIGVPWLIIGFVCWLYVFRRIVIIESITKEPVEGKWWRKKTVTYRNEDSESAWAVRWSMFGVLIIVVGAALFMIF